MIDRSWYYTVVNSLWEIHNIFEKLHFLVLFGPFRYIRKQIFNNKWKINVYRITCQHQPISNSKSCNNYDMKMQYKFPFTLTITFHIPRKEEPFSCATFAQAMTKYI